MIMIFNLSYQCCITKSIYCRYLEEFKGNEEPPLGIGKNHPSGWLINATDEGIIAYVRREGISSPYSIGKGN
jgi:hypothetical protein